MPRVDSIASLERCICGKCLVAYVKGEAMAIDKMDCICLPRGQITMRFCRNIGQDVVKQKVLDADTPQRVHEFNQLCEAQGINAQSILNGVRNANDNKWAHIRAEVARMREPVLVEEPEEDYRA